jgi:hypothetical protein
LLLGVAAGQNAGQIFFKKTESLFQNKIKYYICTAIEKRLRNGGCSSVG